MSHGRFRVVVKALITRSGEVLIGRKEEEEGHPISGQWHLLGGHLEHGESLHESVKREVKEETALDVDVSSLVESTTFAWGEDQETNSIQYLFHCEVSQGEAQPKDDLADVKWVKPSNLVEELGEEEAERVKESEKQKNLSEN
ncbi:NUDIX hydrolase [Candidatus Nanohalobium constans]|uniref:Nucleoside triphosphatase n=1 Tax=Candidatus Nanohalobium constans TaxID=2565781 RepID=A0A5Q0UGT1_9ARCH|nr:NUDIX domain-containing protein [Candidatus Nanohalobium constans]QGA80189.1 nucleoside triphosphatase [Candidatus Nanohalobium constans]